MTVYGITMVKDEVDVIEGTLRHMAGQVDHMIVADNASTDGTRQILDTLAGELSMTVVDDSEPAYYQSHKMSHLAAAAARMNPDSVPVWIVPFDADELWYSPLGPIREVLENTIDIHTARADLYNHFRSALDVEDPDPFRSMVWRQATPAPLPKMAFQWREGAVVHQGNHGVTLPFPPQVFGDLTGVLQVRHYPYRSVEQFIRKGRNGAAAYALTDLPDNQGAHWRGYGDIYERLGEPGLAEVFNRHFWYPSPIDGGLVNDPAPYLRWPA